MQCTCLLSDPAVWLKHIVLLTHFKTKRLRALPYFWGYLWPCEPLQQIPQQINEPPRQQEVQSADDVTIIYHSLKLIFHLHNMTPLNSSRQDIYTRHIEEPPASRCSQTAAASIRSLAWHSPDLLLFICHTTLTQDEHGFLNSSITSGEPLPLHTSRSVWQWEGCHAELTLFKFLPWLAESDGRWRDGQTGQQLESRGLGWFYPVSKLRGFPAHLPRNLASFSPSVDDCDGGGSRPRRLGQHWWFLSHRRGGVWVPTVYFNRRGQRSYWRTCGRKYTISKQLCDI